MKTLKHICQFVKTGEFRQYNYGIKKNMKIYKNFEPSKYDLKNIKMPISVFWAVNDVMNNFKVSI